jgi:pimeloyl-ACP methyl ester carboxylesterase
MDLAARSLPVRGHDGIRLAADAFGDPEATPVVLLHGGGQTRHAWGTAGDVLATRGRYAVSVDLRGHGDSDWAADGDYGMTAFARDTAAVVASLSSVAPPVLVGASVEARWGELAPRVMAGGLTGVPDDAVARIAEYVDAGADAVNIALRAPWPPESLDAWIDDVVPRVRRSYS